MKPKRKTQLKLTPEKHDDQPVGIVASHSCLCCTLTVGDCVVLQGLSSLEIEGNKIIGTMTQ